MGEIVGSRVGDAVGLSVGESVGLSVGVSVGLSVGVSVGDFSEENRLEYDHICHLDPLIHNILCYLLESEI